MKTLEVLLLVAGLCLVALCQEPPGKTEAKPAAPPAKEDSASRQMIGGAPVDPKSYVIGPEDVLTIRVWREPELSGVLPVRPDGKITMQLINELQAAGLTPVQLAGTIAESLSKFMNRPEVTVAVQTVNSKRYFIQGEIRKPGPYPLVLPTTVLEALVNAGGFMDFANKKKIVILRGKERFKFNYNDVIKGKSSEQNILLESGDHIIVP